MLTDKQIKHMRDRFLGWKLPENFTPDAGVKFTPLPYQNYNSGYWLSGTNIFDARQAEEMIRFMVEGMPSETDN